MKINSYVFIFPLRVKTNILLNFDFKPTFFTIKFAPNEYFFVKTDDIMWRSVMRSIWIHAILFSYFLDDVSFDSRIYSETCLIDNSWEH